MDILLTAMGILFAIRFIQFTIQAVAVTALFLVSNILLLFRVSVFERMMVTRMQKISTLNYDDFKDSFVGKEMLKTCWKQLWLDCFKSVQKGCIIEPKEYMLCSVPVEAEAYATDTKDGSDLNANYLGSLEPYSTTLDDFVNIGNLARQDVPLVLNFGSCS